MAYLYLLNWSPPELWYSRAVRLIIRLKKHKFKISIFGFTLLFILNLKISSLGFETCSILIQFYFLNTRVFYSCCLTERHNLTVSYYRHLCFDSMGNWRFQTDWMTFEPDFRQNRSFSCRDVIFLFKITLRQIWTDYFHLST